MLRALVALRGVLHELDRLAAERIDDGGDAHGEGEDVLGGRVLGASQIEGRRIGGGQERVAADDGKVVSAVTGPIAVREEEALVDASVNFGVHHVAVGRREVVQVLGLGERGAGRVEAVGAVGVGGGGGGVVVAGREDGGHGWGREGGGGRQGGVRRAKDILLGWRRP